MKIRTTSTTTSPTVLFWLLLQTAVLSLFWGSKQLALLEDHSSDCQHHFFDSITDRHPFTTTAKTTTTAATSESPLLKNNNNNNSSYPTIITRTTLDYDLVEKYPVRRLACGGAGNNLFPLLLHVSPGFQWVCDNQGEQRVTKVMLYIFHKHSVQQKQQHQKQKQGVMLDVGANAGYYGLLAAVHFGHDVVQWDVLPECQRVLRNNAILNGVASTSVTTIAAGVSAFSDSLAVPDDECNGRFPVVAYEEHSFGNYTTHVPLHPLSTFLNNNNNNNNENENNKIMLMKVDTEGNEQRVLAGALEFFATHAIQNAIVEVTPGYNFWKHQGINKQDVYDTITQIVSEYGYTVISLDNWVALRDAEQVLRYLEHFHKNQVDLWFTIDADILAATQHSVLLNQTMLELPAEYYMAAAAAASTSTITTSAMKHHAKSNAGVGGEQHHPHHAHHHNNRDRGYKAKFNAVF